MNIQYKKTGFTLIELLVVVAVIGILSAVVLTSMSASRLKAQDGKIREQMVIIRSQAEIFYHANNSTYANLCTSATGIAPQLQAAHTASGVATLVTNGAVQTATTTNCYATVSGYAVSVKLRTPTTATYMCVDGRNQTLITTTPLAAGADFCS